MSLTEELSKQIKAARVLGVNPNTVSSVYSENFSEDQQHFYSTKKKKEKNVYRSTRKT
jgi:hypothetical protein